MRLRDLRFSAKLLLLVGLPITLDLAAITYDDLRNEPNLTPATFAAHFRKFDFKFRAEVQEFERFLKSKKGDCDDFSTLADHLLRERGYTTKLVSVRMNGVIHVVCYVKEAGGYLDYNFRKEGCLVPCSDDLSAIARQVAAYYQRPWNSASVFTYGGGLKRLVMTVKDMPQVALIAEPATRGNVIKTDTQLLTSTDGSAP
ncbi:MAG TPA: hypothetical protein VEH27_11175 [Methylomirabilota bacterium]|nr:hypothetical protein [Methylomirabilota bacterium]